MEAQLSRNDLRNDDLIDSFEKYNEFSKSLLDAFVLVDTSGKVVRANPLFSNLVQLKSKQLYKADSLDHLIRFKIGEQSLSINEILKNDHPTRIDEVNGKIQINNEADALNLILGVFPFIKDGKKLGLFLLIRDVTAETALQDKYKAKSSQSITDPMTGMYNRLFFEQYLPRILDQMVGEGEDYAISVLMVDIDHFKKINDNHGHPAGDYILQYIGVKLKDSCRKSDILCRYGGEEFLIVLPGADLKDSKTVGEKLRLAVETSDIEFENKKIKVTISIGSAQINVGLERSEQAIARADRALYHSKETGRNKVSLNDNGKIS